MTEQDITNTLRQGERLTLEVKRAESGLPKSVWETYSAFANTIGGVILLGIEENKGAADPAERFTVTGVINPEKIVSDFWNTINSDKISHNILYHDDVGVVSMGGRQIVYINVPQADWRVKPVYLNGNVYKGSYKRAHEGDYHCREEEIKAMIRDSNENGNDGILIEYYGMDDIDPESLRQYRTEFRINNSEHIWNNKEDKEFLTLLGGYAIDRRTGKEALTLAGLLMFGKGLPIRERFANFRMDYLDMSHLVGDERYRDRLTYDGRWENNLYQFYHRIIPRLTEELPRPFRLEGIYRVDDTPQHKAVREALTNAVIHSDVLLPGSVLRVEKHDDHLCLRNPGSLKLPIEQIYKGGNSKARNPRIQNMLRMIGYGENIGSGFPMIIDAWERAGFPKPLIENKPDLNEVELTLYWTPVAQTVAQTPEKVAQTPSEIAQTTQTTSQTPEETAQTTAQTAQTTAQTAQTTSQTTEETAQTTAQTAQTTSQTPEETAQTTAARIFQLIETNPTVTIEQLAKETGKSTRAIQDAINKLKSQGKIKRIGTYKGHWEIIN